MSYTVIYDGTKDAADMRDHFLETLVDLLEHDPRIVAGDADMNVSLCGLDRLWELRRRYGDRFFDTGIQESNLIGMAAGLSVTGKIPFIHAFSQFLSRRAYDQIYLSLCYARLNARLFGSDPGYTAGYNGGTHTALEDVGILRCIPGITIVDVTDPVMLEWLMRDTLDYYGVIYTRLLRKVKAVKVYGGGSRFQIGKANMLREGADATIFASGLMVAKSLAAADVLAKEGLDVGVVDVFTIKPLDEACVLRCARQTRAIISSENHRCVNGQASAIADVLAHSGLPVAYETVGVGDRFGEVGPMDYLEKAYGLTLERICEAVRKAIERKQNL